MSKKKSQLDELEHMVDDHLGKRSLLTKLRIRYNAHRLELAARKGQKAFYEELRRTIHGTKR